LDGLVNAWSLTFRIPAQEQGFLQLHHADLATNFERLCAVIFIWNILQLALFAFDPPTGGGVFQDSDTMTPWAQIRLYGFLSAQPAVLCGIIASHFTCIRDRLGLAGYEILVVGLVSYGIICIPPKSPWYNVRLLGADPALAVL
jgi:hypothetical protein